MQNMKLEEVVNLAKYAKDNRKDYVVSTGAMEAKPEGGRMVIDVRDLGEFGLTDHAHTQISAKMKIPMKYYDRIREAGRYDLLAENVNAWMPERDKRMIRTLDGDIRALVSSRFRCLDNYDLVFLALDELKKHDCNIQQAVITDTNMYLKAITPELQGEVKEGDVVQGGIVIRNSEVGAGALRVEPIINRLACNNGMIVSKYRKFHLGGDQGLGDVWSEETKSKQSETIWLEVRDMIQANFEGKFFQEYLGDMQKVEAIQLDKPVEVVDLVVEKYHITEGAKKDILNHFVGSGNSSVWELANAVTATAKDQEIDEQVRMEGIGHQICLDFLKKKPKLSDFETGTGVEP